ncbi:tyrosine-type recombinase/integrase [Isoptericola halotolerans]|uniref:Integrase n=1 Tax=Isoptericola halotolerans TaxID=300560 RepID=A0ABX2A8C5_9MICO|nr:site-specific integrase [Isoptericola halotolerans]NOV98165.1 integrase [Isoptericola halotolerans]
MASVTPSKRARGYAWRVQARDRHGTMRQETFYGDDALAVERAARDFARLVDRVGITEASRIRTERTGAAARGAMTVAGWMTKYLDPASGALKVSPGTRSEYQRIAAEWITPRLGEIPLDSLDVEDVTKWVAWMEDQSGKDGGHVATKTIKNRHGLLSGALAVAEARGLRKGNPARGAKFTRRRKDGMVILTQSEFAVLLHFLTPSRRPLIMWLAGTGMRFGEATALTWGDIDRDARPMLAHVTKAWQKPPKGGGEFLGPPKTEAGERTISVPDSLVAQLGKPGRGDRLVFTNTKGERVRSGALYDAWSGALDRANDAARCAEAGLSPIGKRPRVHDLRHAHASWLIGAGRPLPYIQARLGHESITTTIGTYGHLLPDAQQGDADAVALAMGAVLPVAVVPQIAG